MNAALAVHRLTPRMRSARRRDRAARALERAAGASLTEARGRELLAVNALIDPWAEDGDAPTWAERIAGGPWGSHPGGLRSWLADRETATPAPLRWTPASADALSLLAVDQAGADTCAPHRAARCSLDASGGVQGGLGWLASTCNHAPGKRTAGERVRVVN